MRPIISVSVKNMKNPNEVQIISRSPLNVLWNNLTDNWFIFTGIDKRLLFSVLTFPKNKNMRYVNRHCLKQHARVCREKCVSIFSTWIRNIQQVCFFILNDTKSNIFEVFLCFLSFIVERFIHHIINTSSEQHFFGFTFIEILKSYCLSISLFMSVFSRFDCYWLIWISWLLYQI